MSILKYGSIPEVIDRANNTIYGLGGSVWTNDMNAAEYIASRLENGTVWINCHNIILPNAPFGGYKESGYAGHLNAARVPYQCL
jgi:aldehyde dehydrogenase (NAD+)